VHPEQPSPFGPLAGVCPSGQQPFSDSAQPLATGDARPHPSKSGPLADVSASGQQPNSEKEQDFLVSGSEVVES